MKKCMSNGIVFNIQRFTVHDGPGIRTEVFLKGCPLACRWCSNPEGIHPRPEPGIYPSRCIGKEVCGLCLQHGAEVIFDDEGKVQRVVQDDAGAWRKCAESCPADAIKVWGEEMSVERVMDIVRADQTYYERSGGGITVSGGEPLVQSGFVKELFERCKAEGIHTCLESSLIAGDDAFEELLPWTDLWIYDLKMMDSERHRRFTGRGNEKTLFHARKLAETGREAIVRIPVIPGINDDEENIRQTADFILEKLGNRIRCLQLLNYMRLGEEKYRSLNREYPMEGFELDQDLSNKRVSEIASFFRSRGIECVSGKGK